MDNNQKGQAMKIERDKWYVTRGGHKRQVVAIGVGGDDDLCVMVNEYGSPDLVWIDGRKVKGVNSDSDLVSEYVEPPKPLECWVNVYGNRHDADVFFTEDDAARRAMPTATRIAVHMREVVK